MNRFVDLWGVGVNDDISNLIILLILKVRFKKPNMIFMKKKIKSKSRSIRKEVIKLSFGLLHNLGDLILLWLHFAEEFDPLTPHSFTTPPMKKLDLLLEGYDTDKLYSNLYQLRTKGWLDPDWKLTKEGWERLKKALPQYKKPSEWDGKWYIISFDIPEACRTKRNAFREKLKKLGFGKLQASVYISPLNYLANVESLVKFHKMEHWVIPSVTDKLGRDTSEELAERVWPLERINGKYENFISDCKNFLKGEKGHRPNKFKIQMDYLRILKEDPQLPEDLLPGDWKGKKAHKLYQKILRQGKKDPSTRQENKDEAKDKDKKE